VIDYFINSKFGITGNVAGDEWFLLSKIKLRAVSSQLLALFLLAGT